MGRRQGCQIWMWSIPSLLKWVILLLYPSFSKSVKAQRMKWDRLRVTDPYEVCHSQWFVCLYNNTWYACWQMQSPRLEAETRMTLRNFPEQQIGTMSDVKIGLQVLCYCSFKNNSLVNSQIYSTRYPKQGHCTSPTKFPVYPALAACAGKWNLSFCNLTPFMMLKLFSSPFPVPPLSPAPSPSEKLWEQQNIRKRCWLSLTSFLFKIIPWK